MVIVCDYTQFCLANIELNYLTNKYLTFFFVFSMNFVLFFADKGEIMQQNGYRQLLCPVVKSLTIEH